MEKLKELKPKHKHLFTDILKIAIFSLIMLAPFLAVGVRCAYTTFNKNAKDSYDYSINEEELPIYYESNEVLSNTDIIVGNIYSWNDNFNVSSSNYVLLMRCSWNSKFEGSAYIYTQNNEIFLSNTSIYVNMSNTDFYFIPSYISLGSQPNFYTSVSQTDFKLVKEYYTYSEETTLGNVFYDSIDQLGNKPLFSWTKDTTLYNSIKVMTDGLSFGSESNILALLLTYWTLNTLIYIIFDIIITIFTKITHIIAD